jgi:nitroreductase
MDDMLKTIQNRHSTRGPFTSNKTITKSDLRRILEAGRWAPTAHNMQNFEVIIVDDAILLQKIGNLKSPVSQRFVQENYQQLSFSAAELRRKKTGILGTMFPAFMRDLSLQPKPEEKTSSFQGTLVKKTPVLLIVLYNSGRRAPASQGDFLGIISLGCVMENMWLMAQSLGISFHILSSFTDNAVEQKVKKILKIPSHLKIAFTCRLGYASAPRRYLRVRRDIQDFTSHNQYGEKLSLI